MKKRFIPFTAYTVKDTVSKGISEAAIDHFKSVNCTSKGHLGVLCIAPVQQVALALANEFRGTFVQVPFVDDDICRYNTEDHEEWFDRRFRRENYFSLFDYMIFVGVSAMTTPFVNAFAPMNMTVTDQLAMLESLLPGQFVCVERSPTLNSHRAAKLVFGSFYTYPVDNEVRAA